MALSCAAVVFGAALRFIVGRNQPLWIDEVWTGAIIGQPTFAGTLNLSLLDVAAPAYYFLMHFWTELFGLSNAALRFPSIAFGIAASLVALTPIEDVDRNARLIWCGIVALWIPGIYYSQEARCYSMVLFLAMACTLTFIKLLTKPDMRNASWWAILGSLTIVTQYHAILLVGCQAIVYLAIHRRHALRTWPVVFLFLPAFVWLGIHLPRVFQYADLDRAWQQYVDFRNVSSIAVFVFGNLMLGLGLIALAVILGTFVRLREPSAGFARMTDEEFCCWVAAGAAAAGAAVTILVGIFRPSFTERYLTVFMPGIFLGVALFVARLGRRWTSVPVGTLLLYAIFAGSWSVHAGQFGEKWNFERASRELANHDFDQLFFLYDTPPLTPAVVQPSSLKAFGSFFFSREGHAISIVPVVLLRGDDPNSKLIENAKSPRAAILWVYRVPADLAYHPQVEQIDHAWICSKSTFGAGVGVVACHRK